MAHRHPGSIDKRGNSYRIRLSVDGERHQYHLNDVTAKQAREYARTKHDELTKIAERVKVGLPGVTSLETLLQRYEAEKLPLLAKSTEKSYGATLRLFRAYLEARGHTLAVHEVRSGHVKDFLGWARVNPLAKGKKTVSNRTIERHRAVLSSVFSFAEELELVEYNPVSKTNPPKVDGRDPVILDGKQYEALLEKAKASGPMLGLYALVLGETGVRSGSEALWLKWEDVDLEEGFLRIVSGRHDHRTKSGEGRWVPMTPRLREALKEHFRRFRFSHHRSPWIFHHRTKRRHSKAGQRIRSLHRSFANAAEKADLPDDFRQHDLRHRRVTEWLAEGKNPVHVKEALGHSDLRVTMGYTHLAREHLRALVDTPSGHEPSQTAPNPAKSHQTGTGR